ncbi:MAG: translation initiation factor IF-2 [Clostridia bacterium]
MENKNKTTKFENVNLLNDYLKEGKITNFIGNIRALKVKMDNLCKEARTREKVLQLEQQKQEVLKAKEVKDIVEEPTKVENTQPVVSTSQTAVSKPEKVNNQKQPNNRNNQQVQNNRNNQQAQNNRNQPNQNNRNQNNFNNRNNQQNPNNRNQNRNVQGQGFNRTQGNNRQGSFQQGQGFNRNSQFNKPFNKPTMGMGAGKPGFLNKAKPAFVAPVIETQPQRDHTNKKKTTQYEEKKAYTKRDLLKRGMIEEDNTEDRMLSRKVRTKKKEEKQVVIKPSGPAVITTDNITVKLLSEVTGKGVSEIIKKFMLLGMMVTINSVIDFQTAELIASEMGVEIVQKLDKTSEQKLQEVQDTISNYSDAEAVGRPPIVTVMGHVDHGKTSLLDYIRKAKVTLGEAGGITQHIGAYRVDVDGKSITFIDTPGHEAFTDMRARGTSVTDIAILVVAADDGIMPQTIEAINHIKSAGVPMIVAINKMDKEQANPDRIKQQLAENNVLPEEWGGDAILVPISAKTGLGIDKLLETILLVAEMGEFKANPEASAMGTILEARLDKGRGAVASLIVRNGTLNVGDTLVSGTCICKVKAMIDENNKSVKVATPSTPVSVLGFSEVPTAGESFTVVDEKLSKEIVEERKARIKAEMANTSSANTLEDLMAKTSEGNMKILNVLLKTDVGGSLEAIKQSIAKIENDEVKVNILHSGVGGISESDVILANASNAVILGFNTHADSKVKTVAERLKVNIKNYKIIYELLEELELVMKGMKEPKYEKVEMGKAEVLVVFKLTGIGIVAGSIVRDGVIARNTHARVIRDGEVIVEDCELSSVKIVKDDVKEAGKGRECGIKLAFNEIKVGDIIECFALKRIED